MQVRLTVVLVLVLVSESCLLPLRMVARTGRAAGVTGPVLNLALDLEIY